MYNYQLAATPKIPPSVVQSNICYPKSPQTKSAMNVKFTFKDQVVFVTGAGKGIGRATTESFAKAGAKVIAGVRDMKSTVAFTTEPSYPDNVPEIVEMDMSSVEGIKRVVSNVFERYGKIDILINNVGVGAPAPALQVTEADFDHTININLKGTFFVSQCVAAGMKQKNKGKIINLSSQAGFVALQDESIYCMSKAAISHLTKCLALEWAAFGIKVNAVAPTFIETPGTRKWLDDINFKQSVINRIPLGRIGQPEDVTGAILFLASDAADLITGTTLLVDGGWTIA